MLLVQKKPWHGHRTVISDCCDACGLEIFTLVLRVFAALFNRASIGAFRGIGFRQNLLLHCSCCSTDIMCVKNFCEIS
ncbi:unnamed protein product [Musa banksii]